VRRSRDFRANAAQVFSKPIDSAAAMDNQGSDSRRAAIG
jgi:hypothetical protein